MLIRSQNKKQLVNFDNYNGIAIAYQSECDFSVCAVYEMPSQEVAQVYLGNYSTEEKAMKVLDMIQNSYQYCEECKYIGIGTKQPKFVFQMPTDEEVEV